MYTALRRVCTTTPCRRVVSVNRMCGAAFSTSPAKEQHEFKAETRKLLDIVTNSIYTDKEVFLRELISNASDALEKCRYLQATNAVTGDGSPLGINIDVDAEAKKIVISDNGIGMSRSDLIANLGTIARSGSKAFVEQLKGGGNSKDAEAIIGQFGVGFYSSFMVADSVSVQSAAIARNGAPASEVTDVAVAENPGPHVWSSDGSGDYSISRVEESEASPLVHGSRITLHLKETCAEFADAKRLKEIIKKYSNFVAFPITVNGEVVNKVSALWAQDKSTVTAEQYDEFYKFISNGFDKSRFTMHFRADAPLELKVLLFFPTIHTEKFGMGRMEPGVSLYSRKVLIQHKSKDILPDWCRFIRGVVDSEDLPLSLSRENPQDSALIRRIRDVLVRRIIRFLAETMNKDRAAYNEFYTEYQFFLKEGVCQEYAHQEALGKLLMFESNNKPEGEVVSLDEYVGRCTPEQKDVYYLVAPNRQTALQSPYLEAFKKNGVEVLLLYHTIDDFVMNNLRSYNKRNLVSVESSNITMPGQDPEKDAKAAELKEAAEKDGSAEGSEQAMSKADQETLCAWLKDALGSDRVKEVKVTDRLSDSPCIVTDHESAALRRMMRMVDQVNAQRAQKLPPQTLEINPKHPIMMSLMNKGDDDVLATLVAEQLFDNALVAAGLIEDPREMLPRLNKILSNTRLGRK